MRHKFDLEVLYCSAAEAPTYPDDIGSASTNLKMSGLCNLYLF